MGNRRGRGEEFIEDLVHFEDPGGKSAFSPPMFHGGFRGDVNRFKGCGNGKGRNRDMNTAFRRGGYAYPAVEEGGPGKGAVRT